jgi:catechol 2,3-dioxygenase-like lactoylglutathione lyase family enzyme
VSRVQLALNVSDVDRAVAFYATFFGTEPVRRRPGYASFAIADPPLKLVLIEGQGDPATLNHLGVEVGTGAEVREAEARLAGEGLATTGVDDTTCCYAEKTETWVNDPDGAPWEVYVRTGDAEQMSGTSRTDGDPCCAPGAVSGSVAAGTSPCG